MLIGIAGRLQSGKDLIGHIIQYLYDKSVYGYSTPDTVEDFDRYMVNTHHNKSSVKIKKFATTPKQIISLIAGVSPSDFESDVFKNSEMGKEWWYWEDTNGKRIAYIGNEDIGISNPRYTLIKYTYRKFIQEVATDAMRNVIHPDVWVNTVFSEYDSTNTEKWVITDVRFGNEADMILRHNGILIKVVAPEFYYLNPKTNSIEKRRVSVNTDGLFPMKETDELVQISKYFHESEKGLDSYDKFSYIITNDGSINELMQKIKHILLSEKII